MKRYAKHISILMIVLVVASLGGCTERKAGIVEDKDWLIKNQRDFEYLYRSLDLEFYSANMKFKKIEDDDFFGGKKVIYIVDVDNSEEVVDFYSRHLAERLEGKNNWRKYNEEANLFDWMFIYRQGYGKDVSVFGVSVLRDEYRKKFRYAHTLVTFYLRNEKAKQID